MPDESERKNRLMNVEYDTVGFWARFSPYRYRGE